MNVALLNESFPPLIDGVAVAVTNYAKYLTEAGDNVIVAVPENPDADDSAYSYPILRYPGIDMRKNTGYIAGYPFAPMIEHGLRKAQVDIIHSHTPIMSTYIARSLRDPLDVPVVMTYHTKFDIDIRNVVHSQKLVNSAMAFLVNNISSCDEVWVVSKGAGESLRPYGYEGKYTVMPNGVDVPLGRLDADTVNEALKDAQLPSDVPIFLYVGRMMWYKGIGTTLEALAALKSQGYRFCMVMIGSGIEMNEMRARCTSMGLNDCVRFEGVIRDRNLLRAWYSRADLFLFPSTYDTNGLVVREAAASSVPTLMIRDSCAAEGVTDCENGFLMEDNAASMAVALARLCEHPEKMRSVGERAAKDLYLSWADAVQYARGHYERIVDDYRRGLYPKRKSWVDDFLKFQGYFNEYMNRAGEKLKRDKE